MLIVVSLSILFYREPTCQYYSVTLVSRASASVFRINNSTKTQTAPDGLQFSQLYSLIYLSLLILILSYFRLLSISAHNLIISNSKFIQLINSFHHNCGLSLTNSVHSHICSTSACCNFPCHLGISAG